MIQLRYTWSDTRPPTLSDYLPFADAIDEAGHVLAQHNRTGSALIVTKVECHGPDCPRWSLLWSADEPAADHPDAYPLTLAGPQADPGPARNPGAGG